uniref:SFRICE_016421 n=1 Tax=Spodoptera frugiperda TaxID=7108 RepID=A0A2H1V9B2_SPOFR
MTSIQKSCKRAVHALAAHLQPFDIVFKTKRHAVSVQFIWAITFTIIIFKAKKRSPVAVCTYLLKVDVAQRITKLMWQWAGHNHVVERPPARCSNDIGKVAG